MEQNTIRLLKANEIECRVGTISEKGLSLLLYKDARVDMKILDEVYGSKNWQRKHEVIGNNLYCIVSIWDNEKKQWISKMDVGTKSRTETEKGEASDSFKRACFSHGIGRELYSAPFIWIAASKVNIQNKEGKFYCYDKFIVSRISYNDNREISGLTILNQEGKVVYSLIESKDKTDNKQDNIEDTDNENDKTKKYTAEINKELKRTGVALDSVLGRYGISSIKEMNERIYTSAMNSLRCTKSKTA